MLKFFQKIHDNIKLCSVLLTILLISCLYIKYFNITNSFLYKLYFNDCFLYYILSSIILYIIILVVVLYKGKRKSIQDIYSQLKLFIASFGIVLGITLILYDLYKVYARYGFLNITIFILFIGLLFTFHKQVKRIYNHLNNFLVNFDTETLNELLGYIILKKALIFFISIYIASIAYILAYGGGYYFEHKLNISNIPSTIFNSSFLETSNLTNSMKVALSDVKTDIITSFLVLLIPITTYIVIFMVFAYIVLLYAKRAEKIGERNYLARGFAHGLSLSTVVTFVPIIVIILLVLFPAKAEQLARLDAKNEILNNIQKNKDYYLFATDNNFNYVIYPQKGFYCRTLLADNYITIKEIETVENLKEQKPIALKYKKVKDNCFLLGDNQLRKSLITEFKKDDKTKLDSHKYKKLLQEYRIMNDED